jgi:biopolymer transport protein ExbD
MTQKSETKPEINVTPLIDVLLVLLIIFMVVSPLKPSRFDAKIPSEPKPLPADVNANPLSLVVTINADSSLQLNAQKNLGTIADPSALLKTLSETFQQRLENRAFNYQKQFDTKLTEAEKVEKTIFVKAPRSLKYGEIIKVIDGLKGVGAEPIGLQIDDLQ